VICLFILCVSQMRCAPQNKCVFEVWHAARNAEIIYYLQTNTTRKDMLQHSEV